MVLLVNNELERIDRESVNAEFQKLHMYKPGGTEKNQQHLVTVIGHTQTHEHLNMKSSLNLEKVRNTPNFNLHH
jgi:hypothetical protein